MIYRLAFRVAFDVVLEMNACFFTVNRRIAVQGRGDKEKQ
jgi:hypothetical protein